MTGDLQNIYNNLFRYLRRELPNDEASLLFDEVNSNPEVAEHLETFRAAKVLLEENELINFKQAAKGYAKQAKAKKLYKKVVTVATAVVAGTALYFVFNNNSKNETLPNKTNETTIEKPVINSTDSITAIEKNNTDNTELNDVNSLKNKNGGENDTPKNNIENNPQKELDSLPERTKEQKPEPKANADVDSKTNESKTTIVALPNVDNEKQSEIKKSEANGEKNVVEQKKTTKPVTQTDEITHKESSDNNWNSEVEKNGCDFTVPETYEPSYNEQITITSSALSAGSIIVYSETMKEVYKRNFYLGEKLLWEGTNNNGEYLPMGLYKIIVLYQNGDKCIKGITILER